MNRKHLALAVAFSLGLVACNQSNTVQTQKVDNGSVITSLSESEKANVLFQAYFDESMQMNPISATYVGINTYNDRFSPPINQQNLAQSLAFEEKYLAEIKGIDASALSGQDLLSYEIFLRDREIAIKGAQFPAHLMPIHQMGGAHSYFASLGSGKSAQPFNTADDYRHFMSRAQGFATYMDSAIAAMKKGIEKSIVLPKPLIKKVLPQLQVHMLEDVTKSVFYAPLKTLKENENIADVDKKQITKDYIDIIKSTIIPAYGRVHQFMQQSYLPEGRDTVGLNDLPNGKAWYEYRIETNTTLPLTADEIHTFGQQEVARILAEMTKVKDTVGFAGDLPAFFEFLRTDEQFFFDSEQALIDGYTQVKEKIDSRVPLLFEVFPKADYEVRAVEAFRAASSAGASYQSPAPDGSRPGIFYINAYNLKAQPKYLMETLSVHEAAPGHHFQIAIQQEVESLPDFRKFGGYTVFAEGWALYAESLGKEMGLFTDPYMWYGRLSDEQLRAMRLVVDTGLHAFGWTRQQAIDFMIDNSSLAPSDIEAEVERYIAIGGQAVSYKVGQRHIRMLRNKAQEALGKQFDVKKFHTQILIDGALPMPILEAKIDRWIAQQKI
ncbi:DUF885 family protein [Paraglaciecola sp. MB-3u-78]|uniref:DUF885 domain-containing protein n=1 Tax=Paraglaciecola sp. MB-3u-78 TaxID=2058332 RepID=UPI000C339552|nr:DUF885 domain-containing protein [Paraglaciecola sp. MB-3u-78]PKG99018.1 DUF885 domain-containing protein [Paraglaciecola sp. MB-3u-78]